MATTNAIIPTSTLNGIANAIIAKDSGGNMTAAQMATRIAAIPTGGSDTTGNGLPYGCPRIDKIQIESGIDENYIVYYSDSDTSSVGLFMSALENYSSSINVVEVSVGSDGTVTEKSNTATGRPATIYFSGSGYHVIRARFTDTSWHILTSDDQLSPMFTNVSNLICVAVHGACMYNGALYNFIERTQNELNSYTYVNIGTGACTNLIVRGKSKLITQAFRNGTSLNYVSLQNCACNSNTLDYLFTDQKNNIILDFSGLDMSTCTSATDFNLPNTCRYLRFPQNQSLALRISLNLSHSTVLSHDSLMSVINSVYDLATAGLSAQTLTLGSTNLAKLSAAEIAIATDKGWTVE